MKPLKKFVEIRVFDATGGLEWRFISTTKLKLKYDVVKGEFSLKSKFDPSSAVTIDYDLEDLKQ